MKYTLAFFTAAAVFGLAPVCEAAPANGQNTPAKQQISAYDLQMKGIDEAGKAKDAVKREALARKLLAEKSLTDFQKIRVWNILIDSIRAQKGSEKRAIESCDAFLKAGLGNERDQTTILRKRGDSFIAIRNAFSNKNDYANWAKACRTILGDPKIPEDQKINTWYSLVDSLTRQPASPENSKQIVALCDEVAAKKIGDAYFQALFQRRRANASARIKKYDEAAKMYIALILDKSLSANDRVSAFHDYINGCMNPWNRHKDPSIQEYGNLVAALPGLDVNRRAGVYSAMLRAVTDKDVKPLAEKIIADPEMTSRVKSDAYYALAWKLVRAKDFAGAEALMKQSIGRTKLVAMDMVDAYIKAAEIQYACGDVEKAVATCRGMLERDNSDYVKPHAYGNAAKFYAASGMLDKAVAVCRESGDLLGAANLLGKADRWDEARKVALPILTDEKAKLDDRKRAYQYFVEVGTDPELKAIRKKYAAVYTENGTFDLNFLAGKHRVSKLGNALYLGNFDNAVEYFELAQKHKSKPAGYDFTIFGIRAYAGYGDCAKAAALAHEFAANEANKIEDRYTMSVQEAVFNAPDDAKAFAPAFAAVNAKFKDIKTTVRANAVVMAGRHGLLARKDKLVEGIEQAYDSLYKPEPRKVMDVPFVDSQISGIADWHALKNPPKPQLMDRNYGGSKDFLVTDVSTGDRGNAASDGKDAGKQVKPAEFSAICDVKGLHLLFRVYDDRMEEVQAGLIGGGAFEMYLAPGINQPYICMLPDLRNGSVSLWHTTYNNADYTRPTEKNGYKQEFKFTEDGSETYFFIPWDPYYNKLPDNGDVYEFENFFWSRNGSFAWNGSKTIHGRSSWGHLRFSITPKQTSAIRKELIFKALPRYQAEKNTRASIHGCIDFWRDPVLGDPEFYQQAVAPLVKKLDSYIPMVKPGMTDAEVDKVFIEAVPYWNALRFKISDLRAKYMMNKMTE